jgi:argininosuccinate lyase
VKEPQKTESAKLWQGRADGSVADITLRMGESISLDIDLYREDISGSAAHARMLAKIGLLSETELDSILGGLDRIRGEIESGSMPLRIELEDIHTHIENRLIELIGEAGKKLHTARSRNDQISVDTHLYVRRACDEITAEIHRLCAALLKRAEQEIDTILPGYTHLQVAQPVRLSHHLLAHFWAFIRDAERFLWVRSSANVLPLGSGALAGVNYDTDREFLRTELGFDSIYPNSMDAVASRDHILNLLYAGALFMTHASRISEEILIWNSVEFSFITLPDSLTTGSSIMPQKKNPDLAELTRGKSGRTISNLTNLLINLKGLPLTYNRDLQEDRLPLLDTKRQAIMAAQALTAMVREMTFHGEKMNRSLERGFATATDLADALVKERGIPFREAHHISGKLVSECVKAGHTLATAPIELRSLVSPSLSDEEFYRNAIDMAKSADKKISYGGSARKRQIEQIAEARMSLKRVFGVADTAE